MKRLLEEVSQCTVCDPYFPHEPNPVLTAHTKSKIVVIGQAPGAIVHRTGIPWDDKSGDNLRQWMGVGSEDFYNEEKIALLPMGFCYPGKGKSGDLPPRKECAPLWHSALLSHMKEVRLTLLIGKYAQDYYLTDRKKRTLTETVKNFESYLPEFFVLPHPSPRNNIWQARNPWFKEIVLPLLKQQIQDLL